MAKPDQVGQAPGTINVDPRAALNLVAAEKEFLRNRCMLLEELALKLSEQNAACEARIAELEGQRGETPAQVN